MSDPVMLTRRVLLGAIFAAIPVAAHAQGSLFDRGKNLLGTIGGGSGSDGGLSTGDIINGLKEALKIGSQHVTAQLGKADGYFKDPAIRIPLPGVLQQIEGPLKSVGAGGLLDDLHLKMNRAAEQAAPKALSIFTDAVTKMSIDDARAILDGPKDAATQYFRRTTSDSLTTSFTPIVDKSLSSVGAVSVFNAVQSKATALPFLGGAVAGFDLTGFTVAKGLDGLFHYVAVEEAAIRTNPAARTTDLLKKVFA